MKVRWTRGSIRLRITPSELKAIEQGEAVCEALALPGGVRWRAVLRTGVPETALSADEQGVTISLSDADRACLSRPEAEGVYFQHTENGETPLRYLVEKDFPCLHPRASHAQEPPTEAFDAPRDFETRKGIVPQEVPARGQ